jgi:hypothetical protein
VTTAQKIAQPHGAMETIGIRSIDMHAENGSTMYVLKRHVGALAELGIPRMRVTTGLVESARGTVRSRRSRHLCQ